MDNFYGKFWNNKEQARRALYAAFGLEIVGTGDIYLVKSSSDADYNEWLQMWHEPIYTTLTLAVAACTSGKGDTIVVGPGTHTGAVALNKDDVRIVGLGQTPYATVIDGNGSVGVTVTGVDCSFENIKIKTAGDGIVCVYGTGLVGAPKFEKCFFENLTHATATGLINIAGSTSRGLIVRDSMFYGNSSTALAVSYSGAAGMCYNNTAQGLNTTEGTCFGVNGQHSNECGS